jgi:hypothetical protein
MALVWILGQRAVEDLGYGLRDARVKALDGRRRIQGVLASDLDGVLPLKGRPASQHLVEYDPYGINIRSCCKRLAGNQFG